VEAQTVIGLVVPMEDLRSQVEPVGPDDGARLVVDTD